MSNFNRALSEAVAAEVRARLGRCWLNAALGLAWSDMASPLRHAEYVEGICYHARGGPPHAHAWLELGGMIIDPTFTAVAVKKLRRPNREVARRVREEWLRDIVAGTVDSYLGVERYSFAVVNAALLANRLPPFTPDLARLAVGVPP